MLIETVITTGGKLPLGLKLLFFDDGDAVVDNFFDNNRSAGRQGGTGRHGFHFVDSPLNGQLNFAGVGFVFRDGNVDRCRFSDCGFNLNTIHQNKRNKILPDTDLDSVAILFPLFIFLF